jgi:hypothetical protein
VARYLGEHALLNREFRTVSKKLKLEELHKKLTARKDPDLEWLVRAFKLFEYEALRKSLITEETRYVASAEALAWFLQFLQSSITSDLRLCAKPGCKQYFFNLTGQQEFCTQHKKWRSNLGGKESRRKYREGKADDKLKRVQAVLDRIGRLPGWKERAATEAAVTTNYITRNLNSRLLKT